MTAGTPRTPATRPTPPPSAGAPPTEDAPPPGTVRPPAARAPATRRAPAAGAGTAATGPDTPTRTAATPPAPASPPASPAAASPAAASPAAASPAAANPAAGPTTAAVAGRATVVRSRADLAAALADLRPRGTVALVPTMGALHAGHRSLLQAAAQLADAAVVSIFVNPLQFGPAEDLDRYPRTFDADLAMCREERVALVFAPPPEVMYSSAARVTVHPGPLGDELEGAARPGHFAGVLTVVAKLFGLVRPDVAVFGEKDYQQLTLIRRMVTDLDIAVRVAAVPTVREPDGLARSSRNGYLSTVERTAAAALSTALRAGAAAAPGGPAAVLDAAWSVLAGEAGVDVDYLTVRAPDLGPPPPAGAGRLLVAARIGGTRLIDNMPVVLGPVDRA